jgi:hypothetical protein
MFVCKIKGSKLSTGSPVLHMRLPSLCINALDPECYSVWTNNAADAICQQALDKYRSSGYDVIRGEKQILA